MRLSGWILLACRRCSAAVWCVGLLSAASAAVFEQPTVTGTTPSGIPWSAVATGTVNVRATTPGPLTYASGTVPLSAVVSAPAGLANQRTLPAGAWAYMECTQARVSGIVSLDSQPTLATSYDPGNGASGTSPYATDPAGQPCIPGWFNQPWSFPLDMIDSGSVASIEMRNWTSFGISGPVDGNKLGYGPLRSIFQYSIKGLSVMQFGAVIPVPEPTATGSLAIGLAVGTGHLIRRRRLTREAGRDSGRGSGRQPPR